MASMSIPEPFSVLSESEAAVLVWALDGIIPSNEKYPAAGELGVAEYIDDFLSKNPGGRRMFRIGIALVERKVTKFADTPEGSQRESILNEVESELPNFFEELVRQTYNGYYTRPEVIRLTGAPTRPPQPLGHPLEPGDVTALLERVRQRGQVYRDA